jgi:hypothetical protein
MSGKMKKPKLMIFTLLMAFFILPLLVSSGSATVSTFIVSPSSQIQFVLPQGTIFNGSISTSNTVRFWVSAPDGAQIVNLGLIDQSATFSFVATQDGNYTMNFENGIPYANPPQVTFTYSTTPDVTSNNNSTGIPFPYLLAIIIIGVCGAVLIVLLVRRKNKDQDSESDDVTPSNPF